MSSQTRRVFFEDCVFDVFDSVYEPAEDSFLLAKALTVKHGDCVLDMGAGCGIQAIWAAKKATKVVAVDINPNAVMCTVHNAVLNRVSDKIGARHGSLFEPVKTSERFDVIIFNAPYLPIEDIEKQDLTSCAWNGGKSGRRVIDQFIHEAPEYLTSNGRVLLVQSTLSDVSQSLRMFTDHALTAKVIAEEKVAFETIVVIEAKR